MTRLQAEQAVDGPEARPQEGFGLGFFYGFAIGSTLAILGCFWLTDWWLA